MAELPNRDTLGVGEPHQQLLDYIVRNIVIRWGEFPRVIEKDEAIIKSFYSRFGHDDAWRVARAACESYGCVWNKSPLTVLRFTRNSDPYFAKVILEALGTTGG